MILNIMADIKISISHHFQYSVQIRQTDGEEGREAISRQEVSTNFWKKIAKL